MDRSKTIVRTSIVGIAVNVVLVLFKAGVGWLSGSIAVILDAVNNLSDALSSIITIIGTKLAGRAPDKKHPYGHGRVEYLTAVLIAALVLTAGVTSLKESVEKALHPEAATYSTVSLIIIAVAVVAKVLVGRYVKKVGQRINAGTLVASGSDALFDAVLSFTTLVTAVVSLLWHISLEGIVGALISLFIIKAGVDILRETLSAIIGDRVDSALSEQLKTKVASYPGVYGAYDLLLHNYGPTQMMGSIHIEVDDQMPAKEIHRLTRQIAADVMMELGILLTVGVYASNDSDPVMAQMKQWVAGQVIKTPEILQMHGFYGNSETRYVMFDLIVDFKADANAVRDALLAVLKEQYPDYTFDVILDSDFSD